MRLGPWPVAVDWPAGQPLAPLIAALPPDDAAPIFEIVCRPHAAPGLHAGDHAAGPDAPARRAPRAMTLALSPGRACLSGWDAGRAADLGALALEAAADAGGGTFLHAACLRPSGDADRPPGWIVLLARSGTGKTTAALALSRAGLALGGDDAAVLRVAAGKALVTPVARDLHVHDRTIALLPWLEAVPSRPWIAGERAIAPADLARVLPVAAPEEGPVVAAILLVRDAAAGGGRLVPLDPAELLAQLVADHVRLTDGALAPDQSRRLDLLCTLAGAAPAYRLGTGAASDLPAMVASLSA